MIKPEGERSLMLGTRGVILFQPLNATKECLDNLQDILRAIFRFKCDIHSEQSVKDTEKLDGKIYTHQVYATRCTEHHIGQTAVDFLNYLIERFGNTKVIIRDDIDVYPIEGQIYFRFRGCGVPITMKELE